MRYLLAALIIGAVWYLYKPTEHPKFNAAQICWQPYLPHPNTGHYVLCSELDRYEYI
jgi:hypothetical protein